MQPEEANKNQENPTDQPSGPQKPAASSDSRPVVQDVVAPAESAPQPAESTQNPDGGLKMPPSQEADDVDLDSSTVSEASSASSSPESAGEPESPKKKQPKKTKSAKQPKAKSTTTKPIGFIIGVIVVSLALMSLVVMMYLNQENDTELEPSTAPASSTPPINNTQESGVDDDAFFDDLDEQGQFDDGEAEDTSSSQDIESDENTFTEPEEQPITE